MYMYMCTCTCGKSLSILCVYLLQLFLFSIVAPQNSEMKAATNLIVNYLPPDMSEDDVRNLFSRVGAIQSCKLIKDKLSQASLGYAFVNYNTALEAEKAIQSLNGLPLQNKIIKVSYARPSSVQIKNANLYIAYLPKTYAQADLDAMFRTYGTIITSKILIDTETGLSRGVGFVRYDKHSEAQAAISALNGKVLPGCSQPILVKFANQSKGGSGGGGGGGGGGSGGGTGGGVAGGPGPTALMSSGANGGTLSATSILGASAITSVRRQLTPYGAATAGGPMRHTVNTMRFNPVSALNPAALTGAHPLAGLPSLTTAGLTAPTSAAQGSFCIFVYNIPETTEDSLLYQLFSPFGAISSVKVIRDLKTGLCKRYGFVNMVNYEEAYQAVVSLNGTNIDGKILQVSFKSTK